MGIVYFCLDTKNDNFPVALKTIKSELLPDHKARQRFLREATIWIELGFHPNIVQAYRVAYVSKTHEAYIELQLIPTPVGFQDASLRSFIKPNNPIPLEKTFEIGIGSDILQFHKAMFFSSLNSSWHSPHRKYRILLCLPYSFRTLRLFRPDCLY